MGANGAEAAGVTWPLEEDWDEDRLDSERRTAPWIKPDWDPLLFRAHDGLIGSCVLRAGAVTGAPVEKWAALALDVAEGEVAPLHLSLVLTHRKKARAASARPRVAAPPVSISVIVPTRDQAVLLESCLDGLSNTRFPGDREDRA